MNDTKLKVLLKVPCAGYFDEDNILPDGREIIREETMKRFEAEQLRLLEEYFDGEVEVDVSYIDEYGSRSIEIEGDDRRKKRRVREEFYYGQLPCLDISDESLWVYR